MPERPIRRLLAALPFLLSTLAAHGGSEPPAVEWSDTSRDVYVDGELEPAAVVLTTGAAGAAGPRLAVLSQRASRAFTVDLDSLEVVEQPLAHFELTAAGATSHAAGEVLSSGRATRVRDLRSTHYLASAGGHTLLISPHQGPAGEIELDELYQAAPTWRRRAGAYEPDRRAVAALAAHDQPVDVTVAFGTWCGDSRNYVPKLLAALDAAANPNLRLELVAIGRGFGEPSEHILGRRLTNVPTVIVSRDGAELGRMVETPAADTVEADLAAILRLAPEPHRGRWSREVEIARGRYVYRDAEDREVGAETWKLFGTEGGGRLLHSVVAKDDQELEIWHRRDAAGASEFVELTRSRGGEHSRTRVWIEDGELRAVTRGNVTGIVEQHLEVPPGTSVVLPCVAEAGYDWHRRGRPAGVSADTAFRLAAIGPAAGKLVEVRSTPAGREKLTTGHGEVAASRLDTHSDGVSARWWLDGDLGLPLRGAVEGLGRVTLEELVQ